MGEAKRLRDSIKAQQERSEREDRFHKRAQVAEGDLLKARAEITRLNAEVERLRSEIDSATSFILPPNESAWLNDPDRH